MSTTRDTGFLRNAVQVTNQGIVFVSGSTLLMSISSSGAVTTTGVISGSNALSASFSLNSALLNGTGSVGFATTGAVLEVSSSQQQISASLLQVSASYISLSGSYTTFSGSASTRITANSSSIQQVSSSQQQISASLLNVVANYATTGSNSFRANQSITGSLVVSSTITAQTLVVQTVTSSIVYSSGSNIFGSALGDKQTFTGSLNVTGSSNHFLLGGSVGIGITNPTRPLQINAAADTRIVITDSNVSTTAGLYIRQFGSASAIVNNSNGTFQLATNDTYFLTANTSGQVGIGTTQPTYVLDVFNSVEANARIKTSSTTGLSGLYIGNGNRDYAIVTRNSQGNVFEFRNETANVTVMSISGSNVGIGTTIPGPGTKLDIRGIARIGGSSEAVVIGSYTDTFTGYYSTVTSNSHGDLTFGSNLTVDVNHQLVTTNTHSAMKGAAMVLGGNNYTLGTNTIAFFAQSSGAATAGTIVSASAADMVIKAGGNVGIGTTNPTTKLHVKASQNSDWMAAFDNTGTNPYGLRIDTTANAGSAYSLAVYTNSNTGFYVKNDGTVSIGTNSANNYMVDMVTGANNSLLYLNQSNGAVGGNAALIANINTTGGYLVLWRYGGSTIGSVTTNGSATAYNTTSDYRLKEDLNDFNGLEKISAIKVYDFKWKGKNDRQNGVIAHELAEVLPYAVNGEKDQLDKKGNINPQGVDYSMIVPSLVKAIQELKLENDSLKEILQRNNIN